MKKYLGIDIGGTSVKYAIVDENYNISDCDKIKTSYNKEVFVKDIVRIINKFADIVGVGISMPGLINSQTGELITAGALKALDGYNLISLLKKEGITKPIHIENDAKCATISEMVCGSAVGTKDFVCITVGTGIGGGVVVDGKLVKGHNFAAGELGILRQELGSRNTLSDVSGIHSARKQYATKNGLELDEVDGKMALRDEQIADTFYSNLHRLIHNLVYVLNPQKILIGGEISNDHKFISRLQDNLETSSIEHLVSYCIVPCKNKNNAGLIGAVHELRINVEST